MGSSSAADSRLRESRVIALRLQNKSFDEIAEEVGYASRGAAYDAFKRAIRRELADDAAEVGDTIVARNNAMIASLWPIAMGDLSIVPQYYGKGKDKKPVLCVDEDPDEPDHKHVEVGAGIHECWVIPSMAKIGAIETCIKLDKRLADTYGTDFQHGLDERKQKLEEAKVLIAADIITRVLDRIDMEPNQRKQADLVLYRELSNENQAG